MADDYFFTFAPPYVGVFMAGGGDTVDIDDANVFSYIDGGGGSEGRSARISREWR